MGYFCVMQLTLESRRHLSRLIKAEGGYDDAVKALQQEGYKVCRTILWRLVNGKLKNPIKQITLNKIYDGFKISRDSFSFEGEISEEKAS